MRDVQTKLAQIQVLKSVVLAILAILIGNRLFSWRDSLGKESCFRLGLCFFRKEGSCVNWKDWIV